MPIRQRGYFDTYFSCPLFIQNGVEFPVRDVVKVIGGVVADNPTEECTELSAGGAPGAPDRSAQFNVGDTFAGAEVLMLSSDGEIHQYGHPRQFSEWTDHYDHTANGLGLEESAGYRRVFDLVGTTGSNTPGQIASLPLSTSDVHFPVLEAAGHFTVTAEITVAQYNSTEGGNIVMKARFRRHAGILTRLAIKDVTDPDLLTLAATVDIVVDGNDAIKVIGAGPALPPGYQPTSWTGTYTVQFARTSF